MQEGGLVSVIHFALSETPNLQEIAAEIFDHLSLGKLLKILPFCDSF